MVYMINMKEIGSWLKLSNENLNEEVVEETTEDIANEVIEEETKQEIVVEDFEITMTMNMNYIVKINGNMVENLICNFNGNNVVYQTNVMNNTIFMDNLEYCRAVEQKFKEKVNAMAEKLNYVQRLA